MSVSNSPAMLTWRLKPIVPVDYTNPNALVAIARKARHQIIDIDWTFSRSELVNLREAVFAWGTQVVGRYKCFDARVLRAINDALSETDSKYALAEPTNGRSLDAKVTCSAAGDEYHLRGHAPFDVVFGYADTVSSSILSDSVRARLITSVKNLGWDPGLMRTAPALGAWNVLYGFAVRRGVSEASEATTKQSKEPVTIEVKFQGPLSLARDSARPILFEGDIARGRGVYLWAFEIDGLLRPWYIGQTARSFGQRIAEHLAAFLAGQYVIPDVAKAAEGRLDAVAWTPVQELDGWPVTLPEFIARHEELAPKIARALQQSRFFFAPLAPDSHTLNRVEGAIGRRLKHQPDEGARRFFDSGLKLPALIPYDAPLRLQISCDAAVEGLAREIEE